MPSLINSFKFPDLTEKNRPLRESYAAAKASQLRELWENKQFCNCVIQVGEEEFAVHLEVLCAYSEYFNTIVGHDYNANDIVTLYDITAATFSNLLNFMYTGGMRLELSNLLEVYVAADYLIINTALDCCRDFLEKKIHEEEASEALEVAAKIMSVYDDLRVFGFLASQCDLFKDKSSSGC